MKVRFATILGVALLFSACDKPPGSGSPFGNSTPAPLLQPFQGAWQFDLEKTLALWKEEGVDEKEIAQARSISRLFPVHPNLKIQNNVAVLPGSPEGEYFFFALHQHDQWVCGKAWHHEDREDPGDMSKCYVRLELKGADLHMAQRLEEDAADPNDPDVTTQPPTGSASTCGADAAPATAWSPWRSYIFVRSPS